MEKNVSKIKKKKKIKKIRKFSWKLLIGFMFFELIFTGATGPLVLLYGPFQTAKSIFVGTAVGSMHYSWLATTFLSEEEINKILGRGGTESNENNISTDTNSNLISISNNHDETIDHKTIEGENFIGQVLTINDPFRIKIGYTSKLNSSQKEGETTSMIAENNNAVAAINGGAFQDEPNSQAWSANGGTPSGVIITGGNVIYDDTAGAKKGTIAMANGRLISGDFTKNELLSKGVTEAVSFDTDVLVVEGKAAKLKYRIGGYSPRTLIGQKSDGSILFVVLDSKSGSRMAATLDEAQQVMIKLGCMTATTLDGGKSTTMYYNGEVINTPSNELGERYIPTAVIVK
ncbi:phosphodiester glycosidase family protein [Clostridium sp. SHJSY1]|uniref:phosphodiester glycosidase family protein n=1 Tax=Clostridium sp. SHJSY1 TaxID=2942483 RepID=UPI0028740B78|nr:phosphodiester glycosidase family protein [Clostridium sp. SHJSY1]MDS0524744.1 phosphodiester glycosidase family protein [Clostridium sp. SHJSY1]